MKLPLECIICIYRLADIELKCKLHDIFGSKLFSRMHVVVDDELSKQLSSIMLIRTRKFQMLKQISE